MLDAIAGLIALIASAVSGAVSPVPGPTAVTLNGCPVNEPWTDEVLVRALELSPDKVRKLHDVRGLTASEICTMPREKLARAIAKVDDPKPDHPGEAASFRARQQAGDDGTVRPDGLVNALLQRSAMPSSRVGLESAGIRSTSWTALGPGNVGGRLRSILVDPGNANRLLVGSVSGGIWASSDAGASWAPVDDFMPNVAISSLVRDPSNPQRIYAGTGEGVYNYDAIRGFGVFVSNDGGTTWSQLKGTVPDTTSPPATQQSDFFYVNRVAVHPTDPNIVLVATSGYYCNWGGVYRTTNATAANPTWTLVYPRRALDVRFDPGNGNRVIVGEGSHCPPPAYNFDGGAVAHSSNAGASFTRVALDTTTRGRVEVAWAPATPGLAVAVTEGNGGTGADGRFWVSTNWGQTWAYNSRPGHLSSQGWYNNAVWVDPTDSRRIVVGGLDLYRGAGSTNWWATNIAVPWTKISQWFTSTSVHADHHAIVPAVGYDGTGNRVVYFGNDGGLYRSTDIAAHDGVNFSSNWVNLNNGLQVTQFYSGAGRSGYPGNVTRIVGGTQDNGSLKAPTGGTSWTTTFGGDGGFSAVDPADPNYYYGEYVFASIHRANTGGNATVICGGPNPIAEGLNGYCGATATTEANFIAPFILDPNNANTMLVGAKSLWRSTNVKAATPSWFAIKPPDTTVSFNYISAIAVAPGNADRVWVGHNHGEVYCTLNGTAATPAWTRITSLTATRGVLRIMVDPSNPNRVFVTYGGYNKGNVKELLHGSQVCQAAPAVTDRHNNLPEAPVRSIVRHPARSAWLYVGTEVGIFASINGGSTWAAHNDGPGSVSVDELFWLDSANLVAATHGRGMFRATAVNEARKPDFDFGGTTDLLWRNDVDGRTAIWLMNGISASSAAVVLADGNWRATASADFNGDGKADVVWRNSVTGQTAIWLMNGGTASASAVIFSDPNWTVVHTGDLNGDGRADLVWRHSGGSTVAWLMNGMAYTAYATLSSDPNLSVVRVADFNGDGKADLVWRNSATGQVSLSLMNGLTSTSSATLLGDPNWVVSHVGDLNGDGKADLVWRNAASGQTAIWLMDGLTPTSSAVVLAIASWAVSHTGDLDGDGKEDLLWRNASTGETAAWLMNGTVATAAAVLFSDASWRVSHLGDFNGDGKLDLVWTSLTGGTALWVMNGTSSSSSATLSGDPAWMPVAFPP